MRARLPDIGIIALLFLLPLVIFWPQTLGGRTLLPTENLYQYEPYATYREVVKAPTVPHNHLVSDLVLQNMQWKIFTRDNLVQGEIPLWNPYQFSGIPFLAAGQQSALYPFSLLYYVLPLPAAYGWFTVVQMWLAGVFMYLFLRGLGFIGRFGGMVSAVTYQLSAFFVINAVFPMIMASAVWLPLLLLMVEFIIRQRPLLGRASSVPWVAVGALALGCNIFAGHVEITYYTLLISGYYAAARLGIEWWRNRQSSAPALEFNRFLLTRAAWLAAMVALGISLGAAQFIPLFEFASMNWRGERDSIDQVLSYAHPARDVLQFAMPNFYGSPAHHTYFDWFTFQTTPVTINAFGDAITNTEWGMKNYVESALYVGILPLALALFTLITAFRSPRPEGEGSGVRVYVLIFTLLALFGLTFMFGLPTYRLIYLLPGINQLNSPFRWIFAVTVSVAVLAGIGADALVRPLPNPSSRRDAPQPPAERGKLWAKRFGLILAGTGLLTLVGLVLSRVLYPQLEPLVERVLNSMATPDGSTAASRFASPQMFYSYQFTNVLMFGLFTLGAGSIFWWATRDANSVRTGHALSVGAITLIALDLMVASWGFNPASDPALLDFTPPSIQWLQEQPGHWRYTTLQDPNQPPLFNANMTWRYGLRDVRGYESIIPRAYVETMRQLAPQPQLDFNRVAPLYTDYAPLGIDFDYRTALESPILQQLGIRYLITASDFTLPEDLTTPYDERFMPSWGLAYEDEAVRIWTNGNFAGAHIVYELDSFAGPGAAEITYDSGRVKILEAQINQPVWLWLSETYMPGWRAYIRPWGTEQDAEMPLTVERVLGNWQGVHIADVNSLIDQTIEAGTAPQTFYLNAIHTAIEAGDAQRVETLINQLADFISTNPPEIFGDLNEQIQTAIDAWGNSSNTDLTQRDRESGLTQLRQANWIIRLVYSPQSFQLGIFASFISLVLVMFMVGVWLWRRYIAPDTDDASAVSRVARNSIAPIILNLFNRGIDFAFAAFMLRTLGPQEAGLYQYAIVIFVWFDIFTNFGLNTFLTREVARDRSRAGYYFWNTSLLRLILIVVGVLPLVLFLGARQSLVQPALDSTALLALGLLYIGLLPNSLSTGMTALFYAFEKAEYPSAVSTIATINKAVFGVLVLVLGYGIIGLASVSIITNLLTLVILLVGGRSLLASHPDAVAPTTRLSPALIRSLVGESWPLMINHFLATIFFQIDVVIIEFIRGARMVGLYSVAYKWVAAINVIPAFFTMAMLPVMSRQASEDKESLKRTYTLSIKLLTGISIPVAVLFTFLAYDLTWLLGGAEYLPDSAIATQLMIWSIPFGWVNSLTQYVLIALDLQRRITWAFIVAVTFNIVTNILLIPQYGYQAAAFTTIASEMLLLIPFGVLLTRAIGRLNWLDMVWRQALAGGAMIGVMWISQPLPILLGSILGLLVYMLVFVFLRPLSAEESQRLLPLLPAKIRPASARILER